MSNIIDVVKTKIYSGEITGVDIYNRVVKINNSRKGYEFTVPLNEVFDSNDKPLIYSLIYDRDLRNEVLHKTVFIADSFLKDGSIESKVTIQLQQEHNKNNYYLEI